MIRSVLLEEEEWNYVVQSLNLSASQLDKSLWIISGIAGESIWEQIREKENHYYNIVEEIKNQITTIKGRVK